MRSEIDDLVTVAFDGETRMDVGARGPGRGHRPGRGTRVYAPARIVMVLPRELLKELQR